MCFRLARTSHQVYWNPEFIGVTLKIIICTIMTGITIKSSSSPSVKVIYHSAYTVTTVIHVYNSNQNLCHIPKVRSSDHKMTITMGKSQSILVCFCFLLLLPSGFIHLTCISVYTWGKFVTKIQVNLLNFDPCSNRVEWSMRHK